MSTHKELKKIIKITTTVLSLFLLPFFIIFFYSHQFIIKNDGLVPKTDMVMILGAGVLKNGDPSPILAERISEAIILYKTHKVSKILITGNSVNPEIYDETKAIRSALYKLNISKEDLVIDRLGVDTYSSMYRAKNIYHVNSLLIATQSFHLPRALFIARALHINAYGIAVDTSTPYLRNYFREFFAIPKAILNIFFQKKA